VRTRFREVLLILALAATGSAAPASAQSAPGLPLVVIDAGHGGVDPGALGAHGTREKDVTLSIAREVARILDAYGDVEVRMTRDRDTLIALRDRPRLANAWRGGTATEARPALFLSIHANAHTDRTARGVETYFLSEALTEDARRVAAFENSSERFEQRAAGDALSFILHDLRQNLHLRESSEWAGMLQERLVVSNVGSDRGVKQAGFTVLEGAFMPAVLVEVGFLSNPAEERMLSDPAMQWRIAEELALGVRDYLYSRYAR
jgi:N-acetylmuramoyl-L-alanine amidase